MSTSAGKFIMAIDQGTTSTRAILFDHEGRQLFASQEEFQQYHPQPGWVEHNPDEILESVHKTISDVLSKASASGKDIAALGITNQRETTVAWDRETGRPLHNALVWLDVRTSDIANRLSKTGSADRFRAKTGLPISTYFAAVKMMWLIENIPAVAQAVSQRRCCFGTMDSWLIYNLSGATAGGLFVTDVSNASRYMLMDLEKLSWDQEICSELGIPLECLPEIRSSAELLARVQSGPLSDVPISAALGDQHAALLGQGCLDHGEVKSTYGTGCFIMMNTGSSPIRSNNGLLTTVGFKLGCQARTVYALEGPIAIAGRGTKWLRDNLKLIKKTHEIDELASSVEDTAGVTFVPAFSGLLAPHWQPDARGAIVGLSLHTTNAHVARAMREGVAFQAGDVIRAMESDTSMKVSTIRADGGMAGSKLSMQIQADLLGVKIVRPKNIEGTAWGAAFAAGLAMGIWKDASDVRELNRSVGGEVSFEPKLGEAERAKATRRWHDALQRSFGLADAGRSSKL